MASKWKEKTPPRWLLSIDPGAHWPRSSGHPYAGCALFQHGLLCWAQLIKAPSAVESDRWPFALVERICEGCGVSRFRGQHRDHPSPTAIAVEKPVIYVKGQENPLDIIDLREIYGACIGGVEADFYYGPTPGEWKGGVEKRIMNERVLGFLGASEQMVLIQSEAMGTSGMSDHVIDGVGIGLFILGRMAKGGVKPG